MTVEKKPLDCLQLKRLNFIHFNFDLVVADCHWSHSLDFFIFEFDSHDLMKLIGSENLSVDQLLIDLNHPYYELYC